VSEDDASLLIDTHTLIWWAAGSKSLSRKVRRLMEDDRTGVFVSAATAWEIATKVRLRRLQWTSLQSVEAYCVGQGFELLPVTFAHGERAGGWPQSHGDPFDRMLAAQSDIEGLPIATNDPQIAAFGIATIW
jgi:PIN domain nuclease of toxin-antitoxin system